MGGSAERMLGHQLLLGPYGGDVAAQQALYGGGGGAPVSPFAAPGPGAAAPGAPFGTSAPFVPTPLSTAAPLVYVPPVPAQSAQAPAPARPQAPVNPLNDPFMFHSAEGDALLHGAEGSLAAAMFGVDPQGAPAISDQEFAQYMSGGGGGGGQYAFDPTGGPYPGTFGQAAMGMVSPIGSVVSGIAESQGGYGSAFGGFGDAPYGGDITGGFGESP